MSNEGLSNLFVEQSDDLIWMVDPSFHLIYANKAYLTLMKEVTGQEKKLHEPIFVEGFGEGYIQKWKDYYQRAINGEHYEIEEHFYHSETNEIQYSQVSFKPILDESQNITSVACQSKDVTELVKLRSDANQLINASLDVFCTINEAGRFVFVSNAAIGHWGYTPAELRSIPYRSLVLEDDLAKTDAMATEIINGTEVRSFANRYKRKNGTIALNLWSARWDANAKLMYCVARDGKEHQEKEEIILNSEQRFKALVQEGSDMISIIDSNGKYSYTSPTTTAILGITPEEFQGNTIFDFIHPEDIERAAGYMQQISKEKKVIVEPFRLRDSQGKWRWIETVLTNMSDNPFINGFVANSRDITEKVNQEEKIRQSQKRFESLVENSMDCVLIISPEGKTIYASGSIKNILGYLPSEVVGMDMQEFVHPDDIAGSEEALMRTFKQPGVPMLGHTSRVRHKNGSWRWIEAVVTNMLHDPSIGGIVDNIRDVTDKVKDDRQRKLLESVITNTKDAVLITEAEPLDDPGPRIIYANEAFTKMTGYTAEEVIGKTPRILQGPNSDRAEIARLSKALENWESCEITTINYKKSGEEFWINFSVSPVADEKGWFTHWIAIERDVTDQKNKELENELIVKISSAFNLESNLIKSTGKLCKEVGLFGKFDWVELWASNFEKTKMQLISHYLSKEADEIFYSFQESRIDFQQDQGLIGKVWSSKKQLLWNDLTEVNDFVRMDAAKSIGLSSVLGIPIIFNDEVLGVLVVGMKQNMSALQKYARIFQRLEKFIGSEIRRKILENDLSHLFDTIPDIVSVGDFQGRFLRINKAGCALLGYPEEEILYQGFEKFIHPDDLNIAYKELGKLQTGQMTFGFEVRFITKSGELIWLSWYCKADVHEGLIYTTAKNITEERKLRELNRQTRKLAKIGSWEVNLVNQTLYWSDEVHQLHETDPLAFEPDLATAINFYREDFRPMVQTAIGKSTTTGEPFDFEAVLVTANKKEIWVRAIGNAEFAGEKCIRIFGSFQDIHDRKEAEFRLHSLADNLPGVVFQYFLYPDGTDTLKFVTKGAQQVWGFSAEAVMQDNQLVWAQIAAGGQMDLVQKSISLSIETKKNWSARWKYILPNGEERTHMGLGTPHFMSDGTIMFHSVILDVSQEVKNEALLNEVSKIAKIGTWETDLLHGNHFKSPMVDEILELELTQVLPDMESVIEFCRADFREKMKGYFTECITQGKSFDFEAVIVSARKKEKWVRIIGAPKLYDGKCIKIIGSLQDISSLKETENRLVSLANNLPGVVYQYIIYPDGTDKLLHVMGKPEQLWGFSASQVMENVNLVWDQIRAGGNFVESKNSILTSIQTKSQWTTRIKYVKPTGELRTHLGYGTPTFFADGTVLFNSIILDVTSEVKNEELLEEVTKLTRIGSWEMDLVTKNLFWSDEIHNIYQTDRSAYKPSVEAAINFYREDFRQLALSNYEECIRTGEPYDIEAVIVTATNKELWVRTTAKAEIVDGVCKRVYGSFQDIHEKKIAEEQLAKAFEEKNNILESIGDAFFAVDKNWMVTYWNKEAENVLGRNREEIVGENLWVIYADAIDSDFYRQYHKAMETNENVSFEEFYPTLKKWFEVTAYPSKEGLSVYFKDVTLRKEADLRLTQANERFEKVTMATSDAIWDWDIANDHFFRSQNIQKFFGKTISTDLKREDFWTDAFHPDDLAEVKNSISAALKDPKTNRWEAEYRIFHESGNMVNVIDRGLIIRDNKGKAIRMIGAMSDITERKKTQELLDKSNRLARIGNWEADMEKGTVYWSPVTREIHEADSNYVPDLSKGLNFYKEGKNRERITQCVEKCINNREPWDEELQIVTLKGNLKWVRTIGEGEFIADKCVRFYGSFQDITERKNQEAQLLELNRSLQTYTKELERSNEELEQFAFITSHDLQEPLRMISSFMEQLKRKYGNQLDEKALQYIHFATDGAKRMKQIILDLLDYSRAGKPTDPMEKVDVNDILSEYKLLRRKVIAEKSATIYASELPLIYSYKAAIAQVFHSLLDNAIKYSKEGIAPHIEVTASENKKEWKFAVKDNGIGIDAAFYDKIFIIFQRLHDRNEFDGNGIGLSIAKKHVEFLGGKIWIESAPEEGSTFYFTITKTQ